MGPPSPKIHTPCGPLRPNDGSAMGHLVRAYTAQRACHFGSQVVTTPWESSAELVHDETAPLPLLARIESRAGWVQTHHTEQKTTESTQTTEHRETGNHCWKPLRSWRAGSSNTVSEAPSQHWRVSPIARHCAGTIYRYHFIQLHQGKQGTTATSILHRDRGSERLRK